MTSFGRSLELFFVDGRPDGMLTAEVFNWTGHVLRIPRTQIIQGLNRKEASNTGVYVLLGEQNGKAKAYIGESEDVSARLKNHVANKDWWETAIVITSTADNLHKAHVKYLESRLVEIATDVGAVVLENANVPPRSSLTEAGIANMESYLDTLAIVLPAIKVDAFQQKAQSSEAVKETHTETFEKFEISSKKLCGPATALLVAGELIVQAGSAARSKWIGVSATYTKLHQDLIENGVLSVEGETASFTKDYAFTSPSAAAAIVLGRSANGRLEWRLKGTDKTYADWEASQLGEGL
jgi:hypothetical protein